jgi:ATP-dependent Zn protease
LFTYSELFDKILILLGGRAAEQLIFNDFTTGAIDDIEKATSLAIKMVSQIGMSQKLGHIGYNMEGQSITKPFSEYTNKLIDQEVQKILSDAYEKA